MQSPAELGHVAAICSVLSVDPENRVLVAVEGDRLTMGGQIHLGSLKVREGALARHKPQQHQTACGIIDKNEEGALWPAILEPPVLTAIDLDQFAKTIAAMARLVYPLGPIAPAGPDLVIDHPLPERLDLQHTAW